MGERIKRLLVDRAFIHRRAKRGLDVTKAVLGVDLPPHFPAEHRGRIKEDDSLDRRLETGVEERLSPHEHPLPRALLAHRDRIDLLDELALELFEDGLEQVLLIAEMVIEGPLGNPRSANDFLDRRGRVASSAEELAGGAEKRRSGGLGLLRSEPS